MLDFLFTKPRTSRRKRLHGWDVTTEVQVNSANYQAVIVAEGFKADSKAWGVNQVVWKVYGLVPSPRIHNAFDREIIHGNCTKADAILHARTWLLNRESERAGRVIK